MSNLEITLAIIEAFVLGRTWDFMKYSIKAEIKRKKRGKKL
jgi:hypothetical protein